MDATDGQQRAEIAKRYRRLAALMAER